MKNTKKYLGISFPLLLSMAGIVHCAPSRDYTVRGTRAANGMDGEVTLSLKKTGNQQVMISLTHLLPPQRIDNASTRYMVWVIPNGEKPIAEGFLMYDEDDRSGEATIKTPFTNFALKITAESLQEPAQPSEHVVIEKYMNVNDIK